MISLLRPILVNSVRLSLKLIKNNLLTDLPETSLAKVFTCERLERKLPARWPLALRRYRPPAPV